MPHAGVARYFALVLAISLFVGGSGLAAAEQLTVEAAAPVVVQTDPQAGAASVTAATRSIKVVFSKRMIPTSWSLVTVEGANFPEINGNPHFEDDQRTCIISVQLQPNTTYAMWINSSSHKNFTDSSNRPAVPYLLVFKTGN